MSSEATVTSLSATRHYGIAVSSIYDKIEDQGRPFREAITGRIVTTKASTFLHIYLALLTEMQMLWYIHTGDNLLKSARIPFPVLRHFTQHEYETKKFWLFSQLFESQEEYV